MTVYKESNLDDCVGCKKKKYPELFYGKSVLFYELFNKKTRQSQVVRAMDEKSAIRKAGWQIDEVKIISVSHKQPL